ncbi:MAG: alpha/beta hydrolase [Treponema sp.]|nr:alpha/beta hydrolase [Treponema sp.]
MPKITPDMIHPDIRKKAKSIKTSQTFSLRQIKLMKLSCRLLRGHHSPGMRYAQKRIISPSGGRLRLCVYTPKKKKENVAGLLWIHGGGYAFGIPEQDDIFYKRFLLENTAVIVAPDYTLSPDKPYPAALEDCYAALLWLKENGESFGMRSDQIFIGGTSAGGGLTAALSMYARDKAEAAIAFQMPLYPMIDDRLTPSSTDNNAPVWNSALNEGAWRLYLGDYYSKSDIPAYAVPARAKNYKGLPPACSFVGSIDPFRDETSSFINMLRETGTPVHYKIFDGCFHAFDQMCPDANITKQAISFLMENYRYAVNNYFAPQPSRRD